MASSILVREFLSRVSTALLDMAPQFERWSESELVGAINDGQRAIAKYLPYSCSQVVIFKLTPGARQSIEYISGSRVYPAGTEIYGSMLLSLNSNRGSTGADEGVSIRAVSVETLDSTNPSWRSKTSDTIKHYTFDPRTPKHFNVYPAPSGDVYVEGSMLCNPTPIVISSPGQFAVGGSSATKLSIDDTFSDDLFNYVLARSNMKEAEFSGNANLAATYTAMFVNSINAQASAMTGQNPNLQTLPFTPEAPAAAQ